MARRMVLLVVVAIVVAAALGVAAAAALATARFRARYLSEKAELLRRARVPAAPAERILPAGLPAPVRRFLERTGSADQPRIRTALLRQRGRIRTAADKPWMPFESEQAYSFDPPGFLWLARAELAPLVHLMARDAFVDGRGNMLIRLLGLFTVADGRGPEIDQGAALRYWGEIVAFPQAVLDPHLRWDAVDDLHARLTVVHGDLELAAVVEFEPGGLPVATHAERYRDVAGRGLLTPWSGYSQDWKIIDGRLFPSRWRSVWHLPGGDLDAVELEILGMETE